MVSERQPGGLRDASDSPRNVFEPARPAPLFPYACWFGLGTFCGIYTSLPPSTGLPLAGLSLLLAITYLVLPRAEDNEPGSCHQAPDAQPDDENEEDLLDDSANSDDGAEAFAQACASQNTAHAISQRLSDCWRITNLYLQLSAGRLPLYLACFSVAAFYGSARFNTVGPDDVRLVADSVLTAGTTQWHGTIITEPRFWPYRSGPRGRMVFRLQLTEYREPGAENWQRVTGTIRCSIGRVDPAKIDLLYGTRLTLTTPLHPPRPPRNPGQFDHANYLHLHGIYYEARTEVRFVEVIDRSGGFAWGRLASDARQWSLHALRQGLDADGAPSALIAGMLLGHTDDIPSSLDSAFRNTGTYHIFAVSGQNVGVLLAVGLVGLSAFGLSRWRWAWVIAPILIFYCLVTGSQPSAVRALAMALLALAAWLIERPVSTLNFWSLAFLAVLVVDPASIADIGFQLSFTVVLALILLTVPFLRLLLSLCGPDPLALPSDAESRWSWRRLVLTGTLGLLASSAAAWIGSLPLMYWHFQQVVPVGLLANLIVVPLASIVVVLGAISLVLAVAHPALAIATNLANAAIVQVLIWSVQLCTLVPGGHFHAPAPAALSSPSSEVIALQTRSTVALLIRDHGHAWLINCGDESACEFHVLPALRHYGINTLDALILTDWTDEHAGGARLLAESVRVRSWITGPELPLPVSSKVDEENLWPDESEAHANAEANPSPSPRPQDGSIEHPANLVFETWQSGHSEKLGSSFQITVLAPQPDWPAGRAEDAGLVLLIERGDLRIIYAGRIGFGTELRLVRGSTQGDTTIDLSADILIQSHHAREPILSQAWLEALAPRHLIKGAAPPWLRLRNRDPLRRLLPEQRASLTVWDQAQTGGSLIQFDDLLSPNYRIHTFLNVDKPPSTPNTSTE